MRRCSPSARANESANIIAFAASKRCDGARADERRLELLQRPPASTERCTAKMSDGIGPASRDDAHVVERLDRAIPVYVERADLRRRRPTT